MTGRTLGEQEYWNETGRIVKDYFKLKLGPGPEIRFLEAWKAFLQYVEFQDSTAYVYGNDEKRAEVVDRFLCGHK